MARLKWDFKDPDEVDDRAIDWSDRLPSTDTIQTSTWTVVAPVTVPPLALSPITPIAGLVTRAMVSGGLVGNTYEVLNRITTQEGPRTLDQTVYIKIKAR